MRNNKKFTIIGFKKYKEDEKYYHCEIHTGARLLPKPDEKGAWWCPLCGTPFRPNEQQLKDEDDETNKVLAAKIDPAHTGPKIISGKSKTQQINKRKKRTDELGNEINPNDKDIMNDVAQGHTVAYYNETVYDDLNNKKDKTMRDKDGNEVYVVRK